MLISTLPDVFYLLWLYVWIRLEILWDDLFWYRNRKDLLLSFILWTWIFIIYTFFNLL